MSEINICDRDLTKRLDRGADKSLENFAPYPGAICGGMGYPYHNTLENLALNLGLRPELHSPE